LELFQVSCIVKSIPKDEGPKPTQKSNAHLLLIEEKASSNDKQDVFDTLSSGRAAGGLNHFSWKLFTNNPSEVSNPVLPHIIKKSFLQQRFLNCLSDLSLALQVSHTDCKHV